MYLRVCSIAGEPAGRGPMATIWRRCSHARDESNLVDVCPHAAIEKKTITAEHAEIAEKTCLLCVLGVLGGKRGIFTIAFLWERSRVSRVPCRSAVDAQSSAPNRAASAPTARPSRP